MDYRALLPPVQVHSLPILAQAPLWGSISPGSFPLPPLERATAVVPVILCGGGRGSGAPTLSKGQAPRNRLSHELPLVNTGRARGSKQPSQKGASRPPTIWGTGRNQQQYLTLVQANPDTCSSATRHEELDALFWRKFRADIVGLRRFVVRGTTTVARFLPMVTMRCFTPNVTTPATWE